MNAIETKNAPEAERQKLLAFSLLKTRRESLIRRARRTLLSILLERETATIDDVRLLVELPKGINPKAFGPVPSELATAGIISADGYVKSARGAGAV